MLEAPFFSQTLLPITLFLITLSIATTLELADFKNIFRHPKPVSIGLVAQMVLLPAVGFLIAFVFPLPAPMQVGLIIIAAAPGGATANLINHLLRGNVALSLTLTALNSVLILVSIPLLVGLALRVFLGEGNTVQLPLHTALQEILLVTIVPTTLGVVVRTKFRALAERLEPPLRIALPILLAVVFLGVIFLDPSETPLGLSDYTGVFLPTLLLNLSTMLVGFYFSRFAGLSRRNSFTISIEVGLHNSALAVFIAASLLGSKELAVVPLVYATFSFFTTAGMGYLLKTYTPRVLRKAPVNR
ncbi:MAG: bile acid:sodium symporter family protein [Bacteroidia bacterium]|nr:bile acid:sodium symporter family protein [Bacteroidia bacterium]